MLRRFGCIIALACIAAAASALAQTPEIGVAASVVPRVTGEPPGRTLRSLQVGIDVLRNEKVATGPEGRAQMLFRDGSALTVGPDSDVVLDEYVYDPVTGTGRMAASLAKGVVRLVGGQISKREPVTLKTPTATIGIRGGVFLYDNGAITFLFGDKLTIDGTGADGAPRSIELRRPGSTVTIGANGRLGDPVPAGSVGPTLVKLEGVGSSAGGAPETPTEARVAATQIAALGSSNLPAAIAPPTAAALDTQAALAGPARAESVADLSQAAQSQAATAQTSDFTGAVFTAVGLRQSPFSSFSTTFGAFGISPKDPNNFDRSGAGSAGNGQLTLTFADGDMVTLTPFFPGSFSASGMTPQGAVGGSGFVSPGRDFFFYNLLETATHTPSFFFGGIPIAGFAAPSSGLTFLAHSLVSAFPQTSLIPTLLPSINGNLPNAVVSPLYSVLSPNLYALGSNSVPADSQSQFLFAAIAIQGQGVGQKTAFIGATGRYLVDANPNNPTFGKLIAAGAERGFVRLGSNAVPGGDGQLVRYENGASQIFDAGANGFFGSANQTYFTLGSDNYNAAAPFALFNTAGYAQSQTDLFLTPQATFFTATPVVPRALPAGIGASRTARTINGYAAGVFDFGQYSGSTPGSTLTSITPIASLVRNDDPANLRITTDPSLNRLSATFVMFDTFFNTPISLEFGDLNSGLNVRSAFIDDNIFAARESEGRPNSFGSTAFSTNRNLLVTSGVAAPTSVLPAGVQYCDCRYAKWGFFSADGNNNFVMDLGTWVAGELPSLVSIPASGSATYNGHAFGSVINGSQRYVAAGSYTQSWDFATRQGTATIASFDGRSFGTPANGLTSSNGREFSGSVSGSGLAGRVAGSFFQGGGDPVAELGGQFSVTGGGYTAVGTVVAKR